MSHRTLAKAVCLAQLHGSFSVFSLVVGVCLDGIELHNRKNRDAVVRRAVAPRDVDATDEDGDRIDAVERPGEARVDLLGRDLDSALARPTLDDFGAGW